MPAPESPAAAGDAGQEGATEAAAGTETANFGAFCGRIVSCGARSEDVGQKTEQDVGGDCYNRDTQLDKLQNNLDQIKNGLSDLARFEDEFRRKFRSRVEETKKLLKNIKIADDEIKKQEKEETAAVDKMTKEKAAAEEVEKQQLQRMNKEIRNLKHQIPSSSAASKPKKTAAADQARDAANQARAATGASEKEAAKAVEGLLTLEASTSFSTSHLYNEIKEIYKKLEPKERKCLLCMSILSENEELKKRMLAYWWAGEGLLDSDGKTTIRESAGKMLETFEAKGLVEPVYNKRWTAEAKRYKMPPVVRSAIARIAKEEKGEGEEGEGEKKGERVEGAFEFFKGGSMAKKLLPPGGKKGVAFGFFKEGGNMANKFGTIFNVKEQFPDLKLKRLAKELDDLEIVEWLSNKLKSLQVLYLGTWQASGKQHIEVDSTEFLKGLKNMKNLKLLSLQGISRINELTDSIKGLRKLEILDLKGCHNLEELPKEISYLKNLTHLDVSRCFFIDHMPKEISSLKKLQVLKGFVVGDYRTASKFCTIESLVSMKSLGKLSVIISNNNNFPTKSQLKALKALERLEKLTLAWAADSKQDQSHVDNNLSLPGTLKKLDIQSYPHKTTPSWLSAEKLDSLEKLYIRGGRLGDRPGDKEWKSVTTLRLKYLAGISMTWDEIRKWFPELSYLEKVDCPLITLCPCDEDGVWVK